MADTDLVPDDGITAGSRTTPRNVPEMRQAAATARELLTELAAKQWKIDAEKLEVRDGIITSPVSGQRMTYADLAKAGDVMAVLGQGIRSDVALSPVNEWKVLGQSVPRPSSRDLVTGAHRFPSDVLRPNMLYGKGAEANHVWSNPRVRRPFCSRRDGRCRRGTKQTVRRICSAVVTSCDGSNGSDQRKPPPGSRPLNLCQMKPCTTI